MSTAEEYGPLRARLEHQRDLRGPLDHVLQPVGAEHALLAIELVDRMLVGEAVAEPGRVAHQLAHRRRTLHVLDATVRPSSSAPVMTFSALNSGTNLVIGSSSCHLPVLEQHHHGDAGDRLRHRVEAEDRVARHRRAGRQALDAVGLLGHDLAVPRQQRRHPGDAPVRDDLRHVGVELRQPLRVEAQRFRAGRGVQCRSGGTGGAGSRG